MVHPLVAGLARLRRSQAAAPIALGVALAIAAAATPGCMASPRDDYDDFLRRADRDPMLVDGGVSSRLEDLSGVWFVNALLAGGLNLALRMRFRMDLDAKPITLQAEIWLDTQTLDEPPVLTTESVVNADGTFILRAEPLVLGPNELPVDTQVEASVIMDVVTLDRDTWCGTATGSVSQPLELDLLGTTFSARRDDDQTLTRKDVPQACPAPVGGTPDGGAPPEDGGDAGGSDGPVRPEAPDLSEVDSQPADIGGQWYLTARLAGSLPLSVWVSLSYIASDEGTASLDGAIRKADDVPGSPALATFTTTVDEQGRFEVWLPELRLDTSVGEVDASILLVGATLGADGFCGAGAGEVRSPVALDLEGTTFGATRFTPGAGAPADPPDSCP